MIKRRGKKEGRDYLRTVLDEVMIYQVYIWLYRNPQPLNRNQLTKSTDGLEVRIRSSHRATVNGGVDWPLDRSGCKPNATEEEPLFLP